MSAPRRARAPRKADNSGAGGASIVRTRVAILGRTTPGGAVLRAQLSDAYDSWLAELIPDREGLALVAVGGLGRREPAPFSDLDLVLLHDGNQPELAAVADRIWYPIWDAGLGLDHAVRTCEQALEVARSDLKALLGLLDVRHLAGDESLTHRLRSEVLGLWRAVAVRQLDGMRGLLRQRWTVAGEGAYLLEPNLKDSRGGLRDAQAIRALAIAQLVDVSMAVRHAYDTLLDVRGALHLTAGRSEDVLRRQDHDTVAAGLGMTAGDEWLGRGDMLLRRVNEAARTVSHGLDLTLRRVAPTGSARTGPARSGSAPRRRRPFATRHPSPDRLGLAPGVVAQDGEIVLSRDADPAGEPALLLRVARVAANQETPIAPFTLNRLATESAPMPVPWPAAAREDFLALLGAGTGALLVLESLDQTGLLTTLLPEWDAVRFRAQHAPVHRFTVDRHLFETAAVAGTGSGPRRRDLLLLGALLHDIGKGYPGEDHSEVGARHAESIARRLGFTDVDVAMIVALVRHHLLLPELATRRDLDDPITVRRVCEAVDGSAEVLDLLHALTIADATATGPVAWSDWKAGLVADLVARTHASLRGSAPAQTTPSLDDERRELADNGEFTVRLGHGRVLVAAPDAPGVLCRSVGVLALHSLDIRSASIVTRAGMAVNRYEVEPRFGRLPELARLRDDLALAFEGRLALADRLADKERAYSRRSAGTRMPIPALHWFDDATDATVLEFRSPDEIGLLYRITSALERAGLRVHSARVASLAGAAVDSFYVTDHAGSPIASAERDVIERELYSAWRW